MSFSIMVYSAVLAKKRFKKVHQMVGSLEKVKEKDQEQKQREMLLKLSQKNDLNPKGKGQRKRGNGELPFFDPILANADNALGGGDEEPSKRKKSKKTPASSTTTSGSLNQPSTSTVSEFLTIEISNFKF